MFDSDQKEVLYRLYALTSLSIMIMDTEDTEMIKYAMPVLLRAMHATHGSVCKWVMTKDERREFSRMIRGKKGETADNIIARFKNPDFDVEKLNDELLDRIGDPETPREIAHALNVISEVGLTALVAGLTTEAKEAMIEADKHTAH